MKFIHTPYSKQQTGHYTPGIVSQGMLYISGQLPRNPASGEIPSGIQAQSRQVFANLDLVLHSAGTSKNSVVSCRIYVSDIQLWDQINLEYASFFGSHKPARAVIPVSTLHYGCLLEMEAVAEMVEE
jgi:reactive intermediate/imine deaminase